MKEKQLKTIYVKILEEVRNLKKKEILFWSPDDGAPKGEGRRRSIFIQMNENKKKKVTVERFSNYLPFRVIIE